MAKTLSNAPQSLRSVERVAHAQVTTAFGATPLIQVRAHEGEKARIFAKFESYNPAGSVKDRIAIALVEAAERSGELQPGGTIIEATSGNTGIALAMVAAAKGYRAILTMPETMSVERRRLLQAYGAEIVLTPGSAGMQGAVDRALHLHKKTENSILAKQFENPANPAVHYATTGPEIWEGLQGAVDAFVAGVGTGGTISGAGRYLRERNPHIHIVAVEPADSPLLSGGIAGPHKIQGIGANFIPPILDRTVYNEVIPVSNEDAFTQGRALATENGILAGISSGAALFAARSLAQREEFSGKTIVVVLPDGGDRYLSTPLFSQEA